MSVTVSTAACGVRGREGTFVSVPALFLPSCPAVKAQQGLTVYFWPVTNSRGYSFVT